MRLARYHPDLAAQTLAARIAAMDEEDPRLLWQVNAALPVLADARPDAALGLVQALAGRVPLQRLGLAPVLRRRPAAIVDLVLCAPDSPQLPLDAVVARLDSGRLEAVLGRVPEAHGAVQRRFRLLRPEVWAALFVAAGVGWRDGLGCVDVEILRELPASLRVPEARRHLALPSLATRPAQRLLYAGLLPWDEARDVLPPYLGSPDPDLRAAALPALAATVQYERRRASDPEEELETS
jgi:hypothetical protein